MAILRIPNLLPSGLTLAVDRDTVHREDAQRFVALFRRAWAQIPRDVRDVITRRPPPVLLTSELHHHRKNMERSPGAWYPASTENPEALGFAVNHTQSFPDCEYERLIAHEVCHCFVARVEDYAASANEGRIDSMVEDWGLGMCVKHRAERGQRRGIAPAVR